MPKKARKRCFKCHAYKYPKFMKRVEHHARNGRRTAWQCVNEYKCANRGADYGR